MNKIDVAIKSIHEVDIEAENRNRKSTIHPLARLLVTIFFVIITVSFDKKDVFGVLAMGLYILMLSIVEELSLIKGLKRTRYMILLVALLGIINPFFDQQVVTHIGGLAITGGMLSMVTLVIKGIFTVYGAYFLIMTTGMTGLGTALYALHIPQGAVTVVLLIYRYIMVLLKEIKRMNIAYKMRAPKHKGIHISAWGSFAGLLLLRTMDRAKQVYESMELRGYGESDKKNRTSNYSFTSSIFYLLFFMILFTFLRICPLFLMIGGLLK